ncbi:retrotransposon protein, putative, ty1-copia subclass [Tanacetum coccineum]
MFVIEQHLLAASAADSEAQVLAQWNAVCDAYNEVACLILGKEGKPFGPYVLKMKGYVEQLKHLGYVLPQDISVGLILNGLTSDFAGFVRNYNMHNMGKTVGELHALLIEYKKGLPKKAATPQVMVIQGGRIQKANKKSQNAKGKGKGKGKGNDKSYIPEPKNPKPSIKERPTKDDACHHCKEIGHWKRNCPVYLTELIMKKKQVGTASSSVGNGVRAQVEAIGSYDLVLPNGLVICLDSCHYAPTITRGVVSVSRLVENAIKEPSTTWILLICGTVVLHISKKRIEKLQHDRLLKSTDEESFDKCVSCLSDMCQDKMLATSLPLRMIIVVMAIFILKHKHEVFETFKVFKNEMENQLGKTIKALRSNQGGEYISQEFKDYLKACGIV